METTTIHPAEAYLRNEQNPASLYVRIAGQRRRLFINRNEKLSALLRPKNEKAGTSSQIGQALRRYTIRHPLPKMQRT